MEANNLVVIDEILNSSTYLVVNTESYKQKVIKKKVDTLIKRLKGHKK